jgi:hypothetical protein
LNLRPPAFQAIFESNVLRAFDQQRAADNAPKLRTRVAELEEALAAKAKEAEGMAAHVSEQGRGWMSDFCVLFMQFGQRI